MRIHMAELLSYACKGLTAEIEHEQTLIEQLGADDKLSMKVLTDTSKYYQEEREAIFSIFSAYESLPYYIVINQNDDSFSFDFKPKSPDEN